MKKSFLLGIAAAACLIGLQTHAWAGLITYELDTEFSGAQDPTGTPSVVISDEGQPAGTVKITINANLVGTEFLTSLSLNLDPSLDPTALAFALDSGEAAEDINTGVNAFQADGDGKFDIEFVFDNAPPTDRFMLNDTVTYLVSGIPTLTALSFNFDSVQGGGNGTFFAAAHVQGIGTSASGSGWVGDGGGDPVPEPGTVLLLGSGLIGLGLTHWRKRTK